MTGKKAEPDERGRRVVLRYTVDEPEPVRMVVPYTVEEIRGETFRIVQQVVPLTASRAAPPVDDEIPEHMAKMCREAAQTLSWAARKYAKALEHAGCRPGDLDELIRQLEAAQADRTGETA